MSRCGMNSMPPGVNRTAARKPEGSRAGVLERAVTEALDGPSRPARPDPEVPEKAVRRKFTAEYKRSILEQADAGRGEGAIGALLRREGLYSSHLSTWRRQRKEGTLQALSAKKRGRKSNFHPLAPENARLTAQRTTRAVHAAPPAARSETRCTARAGRAQWPPRGGQRPVVW